MVSEEKKKMIIAVCLTILLLGINIYIEVNYPVIRDVKIVTNRVPDKKEFKILQISDIHNKRFPNGYDNFLTRIRSLNPDIIVITGDMIDRGTKNYKDMYKLAEGLLSINEHIYFVSGNHEHGNERYNEFTNELKKRKVIILNNDSKVISKNGFSFNLCGVDDIHTNHADLTKALNDIDNEKYTILLSHSPSIIKKTKNFTIDLILSGHTHGGQIRLPFIGAFISSGQGLFPRYSKGLYSIGKEDKLYIDSGLGTRLIPIRFLNRSQMSLIRVIGQNAQKR